MSITSTMRYYTRPFNQDPFIGSPGGLWVAVGEVTGDASGGKRQLNWNVTGPNNVNALYYSLEDLLCSDDAAGVRASMTIRGLDPTPFPDLGSITRSYAIALVPITDQIGFSQSVPAIGSFNARPNLFMGRPATDPIVSNQLSFDIPNSNTDVWFVRVSGYWWWQGAINAPGGFRKPPDGLYST